MLKCLSQSTKADVKTNILYVKDTFYRSGVGIKSPSQSLTVPSSTPTKLVLQTDSVPGSF